MKHPSIAILALLALSSCMGPPDEDKGKDAAAPVPVEVTRATRGDISTYILSTTTVDSEVKVDVYPKHSGVIVALRAQEGDWVQPGQLLAQIDPAEFELRFKQASASYEELRTAFTRLETMHKNKMTSQEAFDAARFAHEKAKIAMEMAKLELDNTRIVSPIRGLILQRGVRYGERTTPSSLAYSIMDMEARIAEVYLPESEIARIRPELPVELRTDAQPGRVFPGKVRKISPAVDPRSGTVKVTVDLEDRELLLRPGMFVRVNIVVDTHRDTVLVPRGAVIPFDDRLAVYAVRKAPAEPAPTEAPASARTSGGRGAAIAASLPPEASAQPHAADHEVVERIFFEAGYQNELHVEALSGIEPGERLVHVGHQGLQPGARVQVAPAQNGDTAGAAQAAPAVPAP